MTQPLGDPERHFWLARSVARTMGLNLTQAMATQRLSETDYAELVARCQSCCDTAECEEWLGYGGTGGTRAPSGCRIADALQRLSVLH